MKLARPSRDISEKPPYLTEPTPWFWVVLALIVLGGAVFGFLVLIGGAAPDPCC